VQKVSYNVPAVYAAPPVGGLASIRLGQSLRSFPRLIAAHLGGRSLLCKALLCSPKHRKQRKLCWLNSGYLFMFFTLKDGFPEIRRGFSNFCRDFYKF
jgi:hypothetical protein